MTLVERPHSSGWCTLSQGDETTTWVWSPLTSPVDADKIGIENGLEELMQIERKNVNTKMNRMPAKRYASAALMDVDDTLNQYLNDISRTPKVGS